MPSTSFYAMGSKITLMLSGDASPAVEERMRQARAWFGEWESCLSRFRADSELSRLNERSGEPATVSAVLWSVLRAALRGARQTGGLVNPGVLAALESAGYDRSFEQIGAEKPGEDTRRSFDQISADQTGADAWRSIELVSQGRVVRTPDGMRLDLGGVAKGWAAERAARRLGRLAPALVNAGGDIAVSGPHGDGQPWMVAIGRPEEANKPLAILPVLRGGVATSGRNYRRWELAGRKQHHLIDPRSGKPAETDVLAATVAAPGALEAEIAAKAVLILGSRLGLEWLRARPRLAGILALEDGRVLCSPCLRAYLV
jgi:thiamine biosynthesis lipoprotein